MLLCLTVLFVLAGCSNSSQSDTQSQLKPAEEKETFNGRVTDLSKLYLSKGYAVNIYRSNTRLGDDAENIGKAYIKITFGIIADYVSLADTIRTPDYNIKKKTVTNVKVLSTSKKGIVEELFILKQYSQSHNDPHVDVIDSKTKLEDVYATPNNFGVQSQVMLELNKIALYDERSSKAAANGRQPNMKEIYNELGIDRDEVTLKVGFRVELTTVSDKVLYKDYEIVVPPANTDITGSEFNFKFFETDTGRMEPFLEKI